ncbi:MAG: azurin [Pseudomonas sp.]
MKQKILAVTSMLALCAGTSSVWARECRVAISGNDQMKFDKSTITIAADCTSIDLTLTHTGKLPVNVMGHDWVLTKTEDVQAVANDGMRSTLADGYLKKDDTRVIAATRLIGGGESVTVSFPIAKLAKGGDYTFFCSFPGHWAIMKGKLTLT